MEKSLEELDLKIVGGKYGDVDIVAAWDGRSAMLLDNGIKWNTLNLDTMKTFNELYSSTELAYGDVLITGLGFGLMLRMLEKKSSVKSITVLEISQDVIDSFLIHNKVSDKTNIIKANASTYVTDKKYDGVFLDHYEDQEFRWKVKDINTVLKNIKHDVAWVWSLEGMFYEWGILQGLLPSTFGSVPTAKELTEDFEKFWPEYVEFHFPEIDFLHKIDLRKIHKYVNIFYSKKVQD
jgi:hypothetical protein